MVLVTKFAHTFGKRGVHGQYAALALHRFENHGTGAVRNLLFKSTNVIERQMGNRTRTRAKAGRILILPADTDREKRAAVETVREGDDFILLLAIIVKSRSAGELERSLIGFGAGVCKKHPVKPCE